jgi:hypothetical protein
VTDSTNQLLMQPAPIGHGWYARAYDGSVDEVWVFGGSTSWVGVSAAGTVVLTGSGTPPFGWLSATKAEAIERVLADADAELSRARAAVDSLRAALATVGVEP